MIRAHVTIQPALLKRRLFARQIPGKSFQPRKKNKQNQDNPVFRRWESLIRLLPVFVYPSPMSYRYNRGGHNG